MGVHCSVFISLKFFKIKSWGKKGHIENPLFLENFVPPKVKESRTYLTFIVKTSQMQVLWQKTPFPSKKSSYTHIAHVLREQVLQGLAHGVTFRHDSLTPVITRAGRVGHEGSPTNDAFQALLQGRPKSLLTEAQGVHNDLFLQRKHYWMLVLICVPSIIWKGEESVD